MKPLAVSVPKAAQLLSLSRSTTYAAVDRGDIPSIRVGSRILIPLAALETLISGAAAKAEPEDEHVDAWLEERTVASTDEGKALR